MCALKLPRVNVASILMSLPAVVMTVSYSDAISSALLGDGCVEAPIVSQGRAGTHSCGLRAGHGSHRPFFLP